MCSKIWIFNLQKEDEPPKLHKQAIKDTESAKPNFDIIPAYLHNFIIVCTYKIGPPYKQHSQNKTNLCWLYSQLFDYVNKPLT